MGGVKRPRRVYAPGLLISRPAFPWHAPEMHGVIVKPLQVYLDQGLRMTRTLYATFDGEVLRPDEPVTLAPNTRVRLVIETPEDAESRPASFLRTALSLDLQGPVDWSARLDQR